MPYSFSGSVCAWFGWPNAVTSTKSSHVTFSPHTNSPTSEITSLMRLYREYSLLMDSFNSTKNFEDFKTGTNFQGKIPENPELFNRKLRKFEKT